jgi:hypothetical protein
VLLCSCLADRGLVSCSCTGIEQILQPPCVWRHTTPLKLEYVLLLQCSRVLPRYRRSRARDHPLRQRPEPPRALLPTRLRLDWSWACCETLFSVRPAVLANRTSSAIGTPLEWPEAKKVAGHVRSWGIEVRLYQSIREGCSNVMAAITGHLAECQGQREGRVALGR